VELELAVGVTQSPSMSHDCNLYLGTVHGFPGAMNERCFDHVVGRVRTVAADLPDGRTGDHVRYPMEDIALSAFAVFFTQCPSS